VTDSLERREAGSLAAVFGSRMIARVVSFGRHIVIARLLSPDDVGLAAIAFLTLQTAEVVSYPGSHETLVQMDEVDDQDLDTVWTLQVLRRIALAAILFAVAGPVANLLGNADATPLIRIMGLVYIVLGLSNVAVLMLERSVEYAPIARRAVWMTFIGTTADLVLAFILRNAWALVIAALITAVFDVITSYIIRPYRPRLRIVRERFGAIYRFGLWVTGLRILRHATEAGDDILVGRRLGTDRLGIYQMGYRISSGPVLDIVQALATTSLTMTARTRDDVARTTRNFLKRLSVSMLVIALAMAGLIGVGREATAVALGDTWRDVGPVAQVLALALFFRAIEGLTIDALVGFGRPTHAVVAKLVQVVTFIPASLILATRWGLPGFALGTAIGGFFGQAVAMTALRRALGFSWAEPLRRIGAALTAGTFALAVIVFVGLLIESDLGTVLIASPLGVAAYVTAIRWKPLAAELEVDAIIATVSEFIPSRRSSRT